MGSDSRQPAARVTDIDTGHPPAVPTPIITGSTNVFINNLPAAREGDMLVPHHPGVRLISEGSNSVLINGKRAARVTDAINCGGVIITGSSNVLIGNQPGGVRNVISSLELDDYIRESMKPKNIGLTPLQETQLAADTAVKYRGLEGAIATWHDFFMSNAPAPGDMNDPAKAEGYRRARVESASLSPNSTAGMAAYAKNLGELEASAGKLSTDKAFVEDGEWTPVRKALHDQLIADKMSWANALPPAEGDPTIFAMRGNSGAGKSRFVNAGGIPGIENMDAIPVVNPDHFKELLIEKTIVKITHDQAHEESSLLADRYQQELIATTDVNGKPVSLMIDKRLGKPASVNTLKNSALNSGRKLNVYDIDAPLEMSLIGILQRKPGGADPIVPWHVVADGGFEPARANRKKIMDIFADNPELGEYKLFGTKANGDKALVAQVRGGELVVEDKNLYKELMADPSAEMARVKNTVIDTQEINRLTAQLPEGGWKKGVADILEQHRGKTWYRAITDHGGF